MIFALALKSHAQSLESTFALINDYVTENNEGRYDILQTLIEQNANLTQEGARTIYEESIELSKKEKNNLFHVLGASILADVLFYQNNLDSSYYYYMLQGSIAERNNDPIGASFGFGNAAYILTQKGQFTQALALRRRLNPMVLESNVQRNIADQLYNLGTLFYKIDEIDSSIFYISKTVELDKQSKNIQGMIHNLHILIDLNIKASTLENAESLCKECIELAEEIDYKRGLSTCLFYYSITEKEKNNIGRSSELIDEAIEIDQERKDNTRMGSLLNLKAHLAEYDSEEEVEGLYRSAMGQSRNTDNYLELIKNGMDLAKFYFRRGAFNKSQDMLDSITSWTIDNSTFEIENEILDLKLAIFTLQNDQDAIINLLKRKNEITSVKLESQSNLNVSNLEQTYNLFQTERELDRLVLQNQLNISKSKRRNILYGSIAIITLMLASLAYLALLNQRNRNKVLKQTAEEDHLRMNLLVLEKEMDSLRSQMNPHFLFNSLNSINDYIMNKESRDASRYLSKFSQLMRVILKNSKTKFVSLSDELSAIGLYMEMEKLRFGDKFDFSLNVSEQIKQDQIMIPAMLIQPYLENSVKHGIKNLDRKGLISVTILGEGKNRIVIKVKDNGVGRRRAEESKNKLKLKKKSYGTEITSNRVDLLNKIYNVDASIEYIDHLNPTGTEVVIRLNTSFKTNCYGKI